MVNTDTAWKKKIQKVAPRKFAKELISTLLLSCVLTSYWQTASSQVVRELCEVMTSTFGVKLRATVLILTHYYPQT